MNALNPKCLLKVVATVACLAAVSVAKAEVVNGVTYIDGVTVHSFSSEANLGEATYRYAANTVSGIGLTASSGVHDSTAIHMWMTRGNIFGGNGTRYPDTLPGAYIVFDLGDLYNLSNIHVWNFCEGLSDPYAVNTVNIAASATTTFGAGTTMTLTQETGARTGYDYAFAATGVRYVKFTIQSNYGGGYHLTGLAKVRFLAASANEVVMMAKANVTPGAAIGTLVGKVQARSPDGAPTFAFAGGSDDAKFSLGTVTEVSPGTGVYSADLNMAVVASATSGTKYYADIQATLGAKTSVQAIEIEVTSGTLPSGTIFLFQ